MNRSSLIVPTRLNFDGPRAHLTVGPCSKGVLRPLVTGAHRFTLISTPSGWLVEKLNARGESEALIGVEAKHVTRSKGHDIIRSLILWHQPMVGPRRKTCERTAVSMEMLAASSGAKIGAQPVIDIPLVFEFTRDEVEAIDFTRFLKVFGPEQLPGGPELATVAGRVTFLVDGYDDDARKLWEIPEVRRFYNAWWNAWPYALYFADLNNDGFKVIASCCLDSLQWVVRADATTGRLSFNIDAVRSWTMPKLDYLTALSLRAGISEEACLTRWGELVTYLCVPSLVNAR